MTDEEFLRERDKIDIEWKQLILYGEKQNYDISNIGTIRNHETKIEYKLHKTPGMKNTYEFITIKLNNGKKLGTGIHRLMAIMFIPIPKKYIKKGIPVSKLVVDHIDNIKYHNIYTNLQWLTPSENNLKSLNDPLTIRSICIPDKTVKKICDDLMKGYTIYDISKKYNYSELSIYNIRFYHSYKYITKKYKFPSNRLTESDIIKVCDLIMENKTFEEISKITGISKSKIAQISNKTSWIYITEKYDFPNRKIVTPEKRELIIKVCKMLQDGKSPKEVSEELKVSKPFVQHIASRESHTDISKDYVFNYCKFKVSDEVVHNICKDLESDKYMNKDIAKRNNVSLSFVKNIKSRKHRVDISKNYSW